MPELAKALIPVAAMIAALLLLRAVNLKREYRGRQILSVYLSPFLMVAAVVAAYYYFDRISFPDWFPLFGGEVLIWNLLIVVVFLAVKLILCPIMKYVWRKHSMMQKTSEQWYEYDHKNDCWCLKERQRNAREAMNTVSWLVALISGAVIAVGWYFGPESPYWLRVFPAAALVVVNEMFNFLAGFTRMEYFHVVGGEDISATRFGAYFKLRKIYEEMFPSAMLVSHTGNEYAGKSGTTQLLENLMNSSDQTDQIVGRYFKHLRRNSSRYDVDLITVTNTLMHHKSALIFNPFYRDLSDYVLLPLVNSLLNNRKCLIIACRGALREDVAQWAASLLKSYSRTRTLWRVADLTKEEPDCEVGILSFSQIYDADVINANARFMKELGFVIIIEPSKMITTSQSGLSILVEQMDKANPPTYCICDHDTDGLVDTMSHVLQTDLTNVVAAPVPRSVYTAMGWAASGDFMRQKLFEKQTHYLGNGIELAAVALKNQIPHVTWYSSEKAPVQDIRWIAGQYYPQLCRYAHLPNQQKSLDERVAYSSNLWGSTVKNEEFVIVEDEFCNLFASLRAYLTRGEAQAFVNVMSENYLLRDYMRYNRQLFMTDPKAVPAIAPHYVKTERNTILRLILMMACSPVNEEYIAHELSLLGYDTRDLYQTLSRLIAHYTFVTEPILTVQNRQELDNEIVPFQVCYYSISRRVFNEYFAETLKNAFFVVEDEKFNTEYIDARLFEHITQTVMPGQFVTYNGKYYRVHQVSPYVGCILHRAADAYTRRMYYRQLRSYHFEEACELVSIRKVMDIEIAMERRAFSVDTSGYLEMRDNQDLRTARVVDLSADPCIGAFGRHYKNKTVLRIALPDTDERMRFTICMLLNEMFRSVFPDAWPYLAVLCARPVDIEGMLDKINYHVDGAIDTNMIYIVEDSDMDLGLLEAVDNNLMRLFEIMSDYLNWHFMKMRESPRKDPVLPPIEVQKEEEVKRRSFLSRLMRKISRLFGASDETEAHPQKEEEKSEPQAQPEAPVEQKPEPIQDAPEFGTDEEQAPQEQPLEGQQETAGELSEEFDMNGGQDPAEPADAAAPAQPAQEQEEQEPESIAVPPEEQIVIHTEGEGLFATDNVPDDLDLEMDRVLPIKPSRYQKECFLKFGFDEIDSRLSVEEVNSYLTVRGWSNNDLTKARTRTELAKTMLDMNAENHCDFCGLPLSGVSYDRLSDGRTRCHDCTMTAINKVEEFRNLFRRTEMMMENVFNIFIPVNIAIRVTDARTIAKHTGSVFKPTTRVAARVLGFAQRKNGKYSLFVESGSPRLATVDTVSHEMTHIWQYLNWDDAKIRSIYRQSKPAYSRIARDIVYEGMAMWAAIQMLYSMGEATYAHQQERLAEARKDVYGEGFKLYRDRFGLERNGESPVHSPFASFPPIDPAEVKRIIEEAVQ